MRMTTIYKRGQGKNTRLGSGLALLAIVLFGGIRLYQLMEGHGLVLQTLVPSGLCLLLGGLIFWLMNRPSVADFMIASEGEIKKVSWSTRKEIAASTMVVIGVVVVMSAGLAVISVLFDWVFGSVIKLY